MMSRIVLVVVYLLQACYALRARNRHSRTPPNPGFSNSDTLRLFSNGELEYIVEPEGSMCSLFGWCDAPRKARRIKVNLSRNLKIKRSDDTTLEIIDRCTNLPLPDFPGKFDSAEDLDRWTLQLQDIMKYDQSYGMSSCLALILSLTDVSPHTVTMTEKYIGVRLNEKVCIIYSGSPMFCGVVVFIGNINRSEKVSFAVRVRDDQMSRGRLMKYLRGDMVSNGWFDDIQYFNYQNNERDTFIVMNAVEMFQCLEAKGTNPMTDSVGTLYEATHFFTLTMEQVM